MRRKVIRTSIINIKRPFGAVFYCLVSQTLFIKLMSLDENKFRKVINAACGRLFLGSMVTRIQPLGAKDSLYNDVIKGQHNYFEVELKQGATMRRLLVQIDDRYADLPEGSELSDNYDRSQKLFFYSLDTTKYYGAVYNSQGRRWEGKSANIGSIVYCSKFEEQRVIITVSGHGGERLGTPTVYTVEHLNGGDPIAADFEPYFRDIGESQHDVREFQNSRAKT